MNPIPRKKPLTFGGYIAAVCDAYGIRRGKAIVQHAVNASLLKFRSQQRFLISESTMKNKLLVLGFAVVGLVTLAVGCNKQETTTPAVSAETIKAPDQAPDALKATNVQTAAESQKAAEDLKAADAQKLWETTAQKQAEADKADQALKQAAADKMSVEHIPTTQQPEPAPGAARSKH